MTTPYNTGASSIEPERHDSPSLGERLGDVTRDLSLLMRQEVALAKAEVSQSASNAGKGIGMLVGAALAGYFVLLFLTVAVSTLTVVPGRATRLQGTVHLVLFAAFVFLAINP